MVLSWMLESLLIVSRAALKGLSFFTTAFLLLTSCNSIGYVEFRTIELVEKALNLSGTIVMGLPINVQLTESERNKTHAGDGFVHLTLPDLHVLTTYF